MRSNALRFTMILAALITLAGLAMNSLRSSVKADDESGVLLTGTVKSAQGEKMGGVTVSAVFQERARNLPCKNARPRTLSNEVCQAPSPNG
jgi:hypothetical protein